MQPLSTTLEEKANQAEILSQELILSSLVHEITRILLSAKEFSQALETFLLGVAELSGMGRLILFRIPTGKKTSLEIEWTLGFPPQKTETFDFPAEFPIFKECKESSHYQWIENLVAEDPFLQLACRQYLLIPVTVPKRLKRKKVYSNKECIGYLWLDASQLNTHPSVQIISHLTSLCDLAGLVLENQNIRTELTHANLEMKKTNLELNRANETLNRMQKRSHQDLLAAHKLQDALLPRTIPSHLIRHFASHYIPAGQVGGDYYDCFEIRPDLVGIVIADVSGHGTAAALVMTMFKVLLKTMAPQDSSPSAVLKRINQTFLQDLDGRHFITVFYAVFDKQRNTLTYCSAGHIPQFLLHPGPETVQCLTEMPTHGLVLGMFPDIELGETEIEVVENSRLVLYTDGISEAHGPNSMFGYDRLREIVLNGSKEPAEQLGFLIMQALAEFRKSGALETKESPEDDSADDATLVILDL